uniref:Secreted protein n=1 Tax=Angiostrongylus cantonensis TaxID=6313 RepID=A0A0K0DQN8_ANGCA
MARTFSDVSCRATVKCLHFTMPITLPSNTVFVQMGRGPLAIVVVVAVTLLNPATSIKFDSSDEDVVVSAHLAKVII